VRVPPEFRQRSIAIVAFVGCALACARLAPAQETPTETAVATPSETLGALDTATPSVTPTETVRADTATPSESATPTVAHTAAGTETPTRSATTTRTGTSTRTPTATPTPSATETLTPTAIPTEPLLRGCSDDMGSEAIGCAEAVICSLRASGETKNYTFRAVAGDAICINTAASPDSTLQPRWTLAGPSFEPIAGCSTRSGGLGCCHDLPFTGEYNIIVQDAGDDDTGNYAVSLHGVGSQARGKALNCGARLPCGVVHTARLNHPGDMDAYRLTAVAGDALNINTATLDGSPLEPRWQLFQPDGSEVPGCGTAFGGNDNCSDLAESGTYTLIVSDAGSDESGNYAVSVHTTSQTNCCARPITEGETIEATLDERGQTDAYVFAADFGSGVNVATAPLLGSTVDPEWRVFGPNGRPVGGCFTTAGGTKSCANLPLRGNYVIIVGDSGGDEVGSYTLALQGDASAGECVVVPSCAGDCDGNGRVAVAEIIRAVNGALRLADVASCSGADTGGDGLIGIDELVAAVRNSVEGCP
jgi:hypothetical protein